MLFRVGLSPDDMAEAHSEPRSGEMFIEPAALMIPNSGGAKSLNLRRST